MPKIQDERRAAIRLCCAVDCLSRLWHGSEGVRDDIVPDYVGVQAWLWLPNLYQIIEQMFKLILQTSKGCYPLGHRLGPLYEDLPKQYKTIFEEAFSSFHQLHSYIEAETITAFLDFVDRGKTKSSKQGLKSSEPGYVAWRYFLLEGFSDEQSEIPVNSVDAMVEIAETCKNILESKIILGRAQIGTRPIKSRLDEELCRAVRSVVTEESSRNEIQAKMQSRGAVEVIRELEEWLWDLLHNNIEYVWFDLSGNPYPTDEMKSHRLRLLAHTLSGKEKSMLDMILNKLRHKRLDFRQYFWQVMAGEIKLIKAVYRIENGSYKLSFDYCDRGRHVEGKSTQGRG